ncbi:hypothetical protein ACIRLA_40075, partial [Streptomyces sp. NPDC102364]
QRDLQRLLTEAEHQLGSSDVHTLAIRSALASFMARDPQLVATAADSFSRLVADREEALGPEHPHTLHSRIQMAKTRIAQGDRAQARRDLDQILLAAERVLEPGHRHIAAAARLRDASAG